MDDSRRARLGKLRWHCRRALLELDLVFQRYWERTGDDIDEETEAALARLLEMEDHDLWDLVSGRRETADPQLNGMVERLIRMLKEQCAHRHRFESQCHALRPIGDWIQFYNHRRPHQALGKKTPAEAHALAARAVLKPMGHCFPVWGSPQQRGEFHLFLRAAGRSRFFSGKEGDFALALFVMVGCS